MGWRRLFGLPDKTPDETRAGDAPSAPDRPPALSTVARRRPAARQRLPIRLADRRIGNTDAVQARRNGYLIPAPPLLRQPNPRVTGRAFVEETVFSLAAHGEAFWRLTRRSDDGRVLSVEVLDPQVVTVTPQLGRDGVVTGYRYSIGGRPARASTLRHLKLIRRPGRAHGLGPIQVGASDIHGAIQLRQFADNWFDTSGVPTGYLTTDQVLGPDESSRFAKAWKRFLRDNEGMGVLSQGLDYKHVNLDPEKAQFVAVQRESTVNIARLFGIPAPLLLAEVEGSSMTYENMAGANLRFLQTTLTRYLTEFETAMTSLLPRGTIARFNQADLLRLDPKGQAEVDVELVTAGLRTAAELRARDGLRPIDETGGE